MNLFTSDEAACYVWKTPTCQVSIYIYICIVSGHIHKDIISLAPTYFKSSHRDFSEPSWKNRGNPGYPHPLGLRSMGDLQDQWRYLPCFPGLLFRPKFQWISPENMAWNMVLTYLHLLDPEDLPPERSSGQLQGQPPRCDGPCGPCIMGNNQCV